MSSDGTNGGFDTDMPTQPQRVALGAGDVSRRLWLLEQEAHRARLAADARSAKLDEIDTKLDDVVRGVGEVSQRVKIALAGGWSRWRVWLALLGLWVLVVADVGARAGWW